MSSIVQCGNCKAELDESSDVPLDQRKPCPHCGALNRAIQVSGVSHAAISLSGNIEISPPEIEGRLIIAPPVPEKYESWAEEITRLADSDRPPPEPPAL